MGITKMYTSVNGVSKEAQTVYVPYNGEALKIWPLGSSGPTGTYTVKLNLSDSNPATWGTYEDDAAGMTAGDSLFDSFFGYYPCILQNGTELGKLNPANFTQYEDGTTAPITTLGNDVMTYFPRRGLKIWKADGYLYVSITAEEGLTGYEYDAFTYKGDDCDGFYRGCYKGYVSSNALYSISGQTPTTSITIGNYRTYARARGTGYEQSAFYQLTYLQAMYLIKYRGQNAQNVIGRGFVDGNSAIYGATGYTNDKGMDWGESTGKYPMKLFGQEDFYGNIYEFIDGIWSNANRQLSASDGNYNDTGSGYTDLGTSTFSSNISGYLMDVNGTTHAGFTPSSQSYGSETTYFCDAATVYASRMAYFGGNWTNGSNAGVFRLYVNPTASYSNTNCGARLMFMKTAA